MDAPSIQTELRIARSYLQEGEAKLHAQAEVIFTLARRVYADPVPVPATFPYGAFFGREPDVKRAGAPLDIGTKSEYREWLEQAATPVYRDLAAALERLRGLESRYPGAALIEDGAPRYTARAMQAYAAMLLGDYFFYRCGWGDAAKLYRQALKLEPAAQPYLYRLGLVFVNQGDLGRAHNFLERCVELAPASDVAVEAHKQLERLAQLGPRVKSFRGSPTTLRILVGVSLAGLLVCLSCICCGLLGGYETMAGESGNAGLAAAVTVAAIVLGGLAFLTPAVAAAIYYFAKRR